MEIILTNLFTIQVLNVYQYFLRPMKFYRFDTFLQENFKLNLIK